MDPVEMGGHVILQKLQKYDSDGAPGANNYGVAYLWFGPSVYVISKRALQELEDPNGFWQADQTPTWSAGSHMFDWKHSIAYLDIPLW